MFSTFLSYKHADFIGKRKGYGKTIIIRFAGFSLEKLTIGIVKTFFDGIKYRYPICCVIQFCLDMILNRPSTQLRWNSKTDYVPCSLCLRRLEKEAIPSDLY
jgi:hypothetical protein